MKKLSRFLGLLLSCILLSVCVACGQQAEMKWSFENGTFTSDYLDATIRVENKKDEDVPSFVTSTVGVEILIKRDFELTITAPLVTGGTDVAIGDKSELVRVLSIDSIGIIDYNYNVNHSKPYPLGNAKAGSVTYSYKKGEKLSWVSNPVSAADLGVTPNYEITLYILLPNTEISIQTRTFIAPEGPTNMP